MPNQNPPPKPPAVTPPVAPVPVAPPAPVAPGLSPALRLRQSVDALGEATERESAIARRLIEARSVVEAIEREYLLARRDRINAQRTRAALQAEVDSIERAEKGRIK